MNAVSIVAALEAARDLAREIVAGLDARAQDRATIAYDVGRLQLAIENTRALIGEQPDVIEFTVETGPERNTGPYGHADPPAAAVPRTPRRRDRSKRKRSRR